MVRATTRYSSRPGSSEATLEEEPHLASHPLHFAEQDGITRVVAGFEIGAEGLKVGGTPSWAQEREPHRCSCGAEMSFIAQVPANFGFRRRPAAPEQPDSFSADDYCLFLGNEVYLFGCTRQCHPRAVWPVVQNT